MAVSNKNEKVISMKSKQDFDNLKKKLLEQKFDSQSPQFLDDVKATQRALNKAAFRI
ncbi:hypothetical protein M3M39_00870 [Fructilactobacillus hinvesii]|uniref:Uncharacterized protein n=1 Tax=Fructilactobacillus hinvesii TaxID=2940300 RepID=A0ABY5BVR5_9LACO|nr:hypothetical protein [Fructilactobacillus hinvesii]USS88071.1 hypothetical protein M3M39_00870 [Fructilactobacillus hinvesii]